MTAGAAPYSKSRERARTFSFSDLRLDQLRFGALLAAILIYGALGSPTPDQPGLAEAVIGLLLLAASNPAGLMNRSAGAMIFAGLLAIGLAGAALNSQGVLLIVRDLFPLAFWFLPLFMMDLFIAKPVRAQGFLLALIASGLLFSLRADLEVLGQPFASMRSDGELYYLANAPTVLFAALMLALFPAKAFIFKADMRRFGILLLSLMLLSLPLLSMALSVQRASLGYFALITGSVCVYGFLFYPRRMAVLLALLLAALIPLAAAGQQVFEMMVEKTFLFGLNMRAEEWQAVWAAVSQDWWTVLFGLGWGSGFESPAVAGVYVHYTHSLLSSMVLKTGLIGLCLMLGYLGVILRQGLLLFGRNRMLVLAIAGPIVIDVLLYAAFKSLDFGLMILLIPAFALYEHARAVASEPAL